MKTNFCEACNKNNVEYFKENLGKIKCIDSSEKSCIGVYADIHRSFCLSVYKNFEEIFDIILSREDFLLDECDIDNLIENPKMFQKVLLNYFYKIEDKIYLIKSLYKLCSPSHYENFRLIVEKSDHQDLNQIFYNNDKILDKIFKHGSEKNLKILYDNNIDIRITTKHLHISLQNNNYKFTNFVIDKKFRNIDFTFGNNNYRIKNPNLRKRYMKYGNLMKESNYFFNVGTVICLSNCLNGCPEIINMIYETFNKVVKKQSELCGKEFEKLVER